MPIFPPTIGHSTVALENIAFPISPSKRITGKHAFEATDYRASRLLLCL